jgi:cysteine desulfurase/selenocysteine lyase
MRRDQFPVLARHPGLVYLDSANTTLKPRAVAEAVAAYYEDYSANVGRATYGLSERATAAYEAARGKVAGLIGATADEVIFTYSATYALNLAARAVQGDLAAGGVRGGLGPGDVILLTLHEHNSNLLIWQQVAAETGAELAFIEEPFEAERVKVFAYSPVSNITGEVFDYRELVRGLPADVRIVVDATQLVSRRGVRVAELGCDYLVFSSHKLYGPSGVGVLYMRRDLQERARPLVYGSQTFERVWRDGVELAAGPRRFEPGTPNIEGVIGLGAAVDFVQKVGLGRLRAHDEKLVQVYLDAVAEYGLGEWVFGRPEAGSSEGGLGQVGVFALDHPRAHPHDIAMLLDAEGIAVRAGKACADILMQTLGRTRGVVRASCGTYTTAAEVRKFARAYRRAVERLDG